MQKCQWASSFFLKNFFFSLRVVLYSGLSMIWDFTVNKSQFVVSRRLARDKRKSLKQYNKNAHPRDKRAVGCLEDKMARWTSRRITTVCDRFTTELHKNSFLNIHILLKMQATLSMTTVAEKYSSSTLKRLKMYLLNLTAEVWFNELVHIYSPGTNKCWRHHLNAYEETQNEDCH